MGPGSAALDDGSTQDPSHGDLVGEPRKNKSPQDIQRIMHMLYKEQNGDGERGYQRQLFVRPAGYGEIKQKDGRGMSRKEQILGDELVAIEEIAQRVLQGDQPGRGVQRDQGDRQRTEHRKQDIGP